MNVTDLLGSTVDDKDKDKGDTEIIDLEYIITKKPGLKTMRAFMKSNLDSIISEEEALFG